MAQPQLAPHPPPSNEASIKKSHVLSLLDRKKMQYIPNKIDLNVDGRVLLSPPIMRDAEKDIDDIKTESPEMIQSPDADHVLHTNFGTVMANLHYATSGKHQFGNGESTLNLLNGLYIRTDVNAPRRSGSSYSIESDSRLRQSASASSLPRRVPSIRTTLHSTAGSLSPGSVLS